MSLLVPPRQPSRELLDDPAFPADRLAPYLDDLETVNRLLGNSRLLAGFLEKNLDGIGGAPFTVLDVGAGSGEVATDIGRRLERKGRRTRIFALDLQWRHLAVGRFRDEALAACAGNAFELPFGDGSTDWVVSALFLHHFSPEENVRLLREISRVARIGFAFVDLRRHRVPLSFFSVAGRLGLRTRESFEDGIASVRQSYTVEEARRIAERAVPGALVKCAFPYRLLVFKPPSSPTVDCRLSTVDSP
jgi:ubiquinone/menaquinone biosynthesis C-methylase UbiE